MRRESDSFGEVELPDDCLYGVRTVRCLANTSVGGPKLSDYPQLVVALAQVKSACARANNAAGLLDDYISRRVIDACQRIIAGQFLDAFPVEMLHGGGSIGFNTNVNEVVSNLSNMAAGNSPGTYYPVQPKQHVNLGQSTADVCHTAMRLALLSAAEPLLVALSRLVSEFRDCSVRFASTQTVTRTCLQDALPASMGSTFGAWAQFVTRRRSALLNAVEQLQAVNLGGTVIGSGDGADPRYQELVIGCLCDTVKRVVTRRTDLFDAAQNIDDLAQVSSQLRLLAEGLLKIAQDIRLLSSGPDAGFAELQLPAVQEGSSFFTGKVNPVVPETVIQVCMQVIGNDRVVSAAHEHGELHLNVFESVAGKSILDSLVFLAKAVDLFVSKCITGITVNEERCTQYIQALAKSQICTATTSHNVQKR